MSWHTLRSEMKWMDDLGDQQNSGQWSLPLSRALEHFFCLSGSHSSSGFYCLNWKREALVMLCFGRIWSCGVVCWQPDCARIFISSFLTLTPAPPRPPPHPFTTCHSPPPPNPTPLLQLILGVLMVYKMVYLQILTKCIPPINLFVCKLQILWNRSKSVIFLNFFSYFFFVIMKYLWK